MAAARHDQIPAARLAIIPGVGHMANMEAPAQFNQIVLDYLEGVASDQWPVDRGP